MQWIPQYFLPYLTVRHAPIYALRIMHLTLQMSKNYDIFPGNHLICHFGFIQTSHKLHYLDEIPWSRKSFLDLENAINEHNENDAKMGASYGTRPGTGGFPGMWGKRKSELLSLLLLPRQIPTLKSNQRRLLLLLPSRITK